MSAPPHPDLAVVAVSAEILSPTRYRVLGETRKLPPASAAGGGPAEPPVWLGELTRELYTRLYVRPAGPGTGAGSALAAREHLTALSAVNCGSGTWEPGWTVAGRAPDGRIGAVREGIAFWSPPSGVRVDGAVRPGAPCRVRVMKEMRRLIPGFYLALGDADAAPPEEAGTLLRVYWNLTASGAAPYLLLATRRLNAAGIPFRTKVLADPAAYLRADAGVLYLEGRHFDAARRVLAEIQAALAGHLRPEVPMFTDPLAPGVGVAEDPGGGRSFGESRCAAAARALWTAFLRGARYPEERQAVLAAGFREAGIDPVRPFLALGSPGGGAAAGAPSTAGEGR